MSSPPRQMIRREGLKLAVTVGALLWVMVLGILSLSAAHPLLLLPAAVFLLWLMIAPTPRLRSSHPGLFVFLCVSAIRYLLLPTGMLLSSSLGAYPMVTERAVLLVVYEEVVVLATLTWAIRRFYRPALDDHPADLVPYKGGALWFTVLVAGALLLAYPAVLDHYHSVFSSPAMLIREQRTTVSGAIYLVVAWGRTLLPLLVIGAWMARSKHPNSGTTYWASVLMLVLFNVLIFTGVSRQSALVPGVASLFYLLALFPTRRRRTWLAMMVCLAVSFGVMTAMKSEYITLTSGSSERVDAVTTTEAYFNGYSNIEIALRTSEVYGANFGMATLASDLFGNLPGARMDLTNRSTVFYNFVYYGGGPSQDQVMPFTGQALMHWGPWLLWVPIVLTVLGICYFDRRFLAATNTMDSFLYSLAAVVFGMAFMLNITIVLAHAYTQVVPGMILIGLIKKRRSRGR